MFLSYSPADAELASQLTRALSDMSIHTYGPEDVAAGEHWAKAISDQAARADAMVAIVSDRRSPWMQREIEAFRSQGRKIIPFIVVNPNTKIPHQLKDIQSIFIKPGEDVKVTVENLAHRISDSI